MTLFPVSVGIAALAFVLPSAFAKNISVAVGGNDLGNLLTFSPDQITAGRGDKLQFHFFPHNHSVTQSQAQSVCHFTGNAIHSGFMQVDDGEAVRIDRTHVDFLGALTRRVVDD